MHWTTSRWDGRTDTLLDAPEVIVEHFNKYLLFAIQSDYPAYSPELIEQTLHKIEQLERGEIDDYATGGSNDGLVHYLSRESVSFEHQLFYGYPEWPIWSCSLAQYKAALQGWRKFIDMPESIDSELIVELPDDTTSSSR